MRVDRVVVFKLSLFDVIIVRRDNKAHLKR